MTRAAGVAPEAGQGIGPSMGRLVIPVEFAVNTLKDAHDLIGRIRPGSSASPSEFLAFRRRATQIYLAVADIDRYHHHEAMYWVEHEREAAQELSAQIQQARRRKNSSAD